MSQTHAVPADFFGAASALVAHSLVAEAAVVGALKVELNQEVRKHIGALATPESIQFAPALRKTRSGKIMRRILHEWQRASSIRWATFDIG